MPRDGRPASHLMLWLGLCLLQPSAALRLAPTATLTDGGARFSRWAATHGVEQLNIALAPIAGDANARGAFAAAAAAPLDALARVPRELALVADGGDGWCGDLAAEALRVRYSDAAGREDARRAWVDEWRGGGWATEVSDLPADQRGDVAGGSLLTTGSDNDVEIYRKFGLPCHPLVDKAAIVLGVRTRTSAATCRAALEARGYAFRACADALARLVALERLAGADVLAARGSARERRVFAAARQFSLVAARACVVDDGAAVAVVPVHERLRHSADPNVRLISRGGGGGGAQQPAARFELVALRAIAEGEELTRDYAADAPRMPARPPYTATPTGYKPPPADEDDTVLRLFLQNGVGVES